MLNKINVQVIRDNNSGTFTIRSLDYPLVKAVEAKSLDSGIDMLKDMIIKLYTWV